MEKVIRTVDAQRGIVQITSADERWYAKPVSDPTTRLPVRYEFVPSVTWICDHYPKSVGFYKWLANTGWNEAQALKEAAGGRGSKVHAAINALLLGETIRMEDALVNPTTGQPEPLTVEEYEAILSFAAWHAETLPHRLDSEFVIWNATADYAGTVDLLCTIDAQKWLIDFKTSKAIWPSHELQVSAYAHAEDPRLAGAKLGILQLGYARNKAGWKFTEVRDQYDVFLAAQRIWQKETAGQQPSQKDYPVQVCLSHAPVLAARSGSSGQEPAGEPTNGPTRRRTENHGV